MFRLIPRMDGRIRKKTEENTGLALLRKRLRSTRLAVENLEIGTATKNAVSIVCLKGYVADGLVDEVKTRLRRIEVDGIIDSGQVTEFIQDSPNSLFSAVGITERPDILAVQLLEGRVGLVFETHLLLYSCLPPWVFLCKPRITTITAIGSRLVHQAFTLDGAL